MNKSIVTYLESLGMGTKLIAKVKSLHDSFYAMYSVEMLDAVVSEYVNSDGQRQYESVFFFSDDLVFEANNFLSDQCMLWVASIRNKIGYIGFQNKDFDFKKTTSSSRLLLNTKWDAGTEFTLDIKASGNNCMHLLQISRKYLYNNLH